MRVFTIGFTKKSARLFFEMLPLCERKKRAAEALSYNGLVQSWPEMERLSRSAKPSQRGLFDGPAR